MGKLVLTRIDSRLIHGQVMTKWVNQVQANKIVIVSDQLANDEFMRSVYLMSAPSGVEVLCVTEADAVVQYAKDGFGSGNVLLLLPSLDALKRLYDQGLTVESAQVGGLGGAPNRKVVFQNITLDDADTSILEYLSNRGMKIIFQTIPEDNPQDVVSILKKYRS